MSTENIKIGDIDIDVASREKLLSLLDYIPASIIKDDYIQPHNTGIYVQKIPIDPCTGLASINYEQAEELGYTKLDLLNVGVYKNIKDEKHLNKLLNQEPDWDLLNYKEIVQELFQLHDHFDIVSMMKPRSIYQLAMILALIRPGKRHLIGQSFEEIEQEIWTKTDEYNFRKSHAISYATLIVIQMNLLSECN